MELIVQATSIKENVEADVCDPDFNDWSQSRYSGRLYAYTVELADVVQKLAKEVEALKGNPNGV